MFLSFCFNIICCFCSKIKGTQISLVLFKLVEDSKCGFFQQKLALKWIHYPTFLTLQQGDNAKIWDFAYISACLNWHNILVNTKIHIITWRRDLQRRNGVKK